MKIEQLLVQYFYLAKQVTLQGIGSFTLSPNFILPTDNDKETILPENSVSFQYNAKATEDEALINYIVQQTRKMKPLASADLESYIMLASQFLNIGKQLKIEGIGILEKNQFGEYQFIQSKFNNTKVENAEVALKEKSSENITFSNETKPSFFKTKLLAIISGAILILGVFGFVAWYFLNKTDTANSVAKNNIVQSIAEKPIADTIKKDTSKTVAQKNDLTTKTVKQDSAITFQVVIKNYNTLNAAKKAYDKLTSYGYKLILYTADSITYKVAMPFNLPLADTVHVKDSVRRSLFGGNPYVEIK